NIHSPATPGALDTFAQDARGAIETAIRDSQHDAWVHFLKISLRPPATRFGVLTKLFEGFFPDRASTVRPFESSDRMIDLEADLGPLRRQLATERFVILFEGWDAAAGPLHEFLRHTHWAEFLRCLAQPHFETQRGNPKSRPTFQLIVLSNTQ